METRNYRLHLLNGTDSRFMAIRFRAVEAGTSDLNKAGAPIPFYVFGSDQGLARATTETDMLLSEPGSPYDIIFGFKSLQEYTDVGLVGQMEGSIAWHSPTTENSAWNITEEWEIWNATGDAHPVHLHLVHFEVLDREEIVWDSATNDGDGVLDLDGISARNRTVTASLKYSRFDTNAHLI